MGLYCYIWKVCLHFEMVGHVNVARPGNPETNEGGEYRADVRFQSAVYLGDGVTYVMRVKIEPVVNGVPVVCLVCG